MKDFDFVIIGGGCAGLSLAYELDINKKLKIKTLAIKLNLIPKTQKGRLFLKRIFQGKMIEMPASLEYLRINKDSLIEISDDKDLKLKEPLVIYGIIKKI